jgi:hypothetical protein
MPSGHPAKITHCSICGHFGKTRKTKGIDNEYLCLRKCAADHRIARETHEPIQDPKRAKALYEASREDNHKRIKLPSYKVLRARFKSGKTSFRQLGISYQRSGTRMHQIYREFFSADIPGRLSDKEQRSQSAREKEAIKKSSAAERLFLKNPAIAALKSITSNLGFETRIISAGGGSGRVVSIEGKRCVVYVCTKAYIPHPKREERYREYIVRTKALQISDFVIFASLGSNGFQFFNIPRDVFPPEYFQLRKFKKYIPQDGVSAQNGRRPKIDIARFKNAWHLFKLTEDEKTAPAVQSSLVSSSPAS